MKKFYGSIYNTVGFILAVILLWVFDSKLGLLIVAFCFGMYSWITLEDINQYLEFKRRLQSKKLHQQIQDKRFSIAVSYLNQLGLHVVAHISNASQLNNPGEGGSRKHDFACVDDDGDRSQYIFIFKDDFTYDVIKTRG